jgi:hypothetical protein
MPPGFGGGMPPGFGGGLPPGFGGGMPPSFGGGMPPGFGGGMPPGFGGGMPPGFGSPPGERFNNLFDGEHMTQDSNKKDELLDVARFMDSRSDLFGKPQGQKSWVDEVNLEGNFTLNKRESTKMQAAADMMQAAEAFGAAGYPVNLSAMLGGGARW